MAVDVSKNDLRGSDPSREHERLLLAAVDALELSGGRFVDVGAGDGLDASGNRALRERGWTGVLLTADEGRAAQLASTVGASGSHVVHALVGPAGTPLTRLLDDAGEPRVVQVLLIDIASDDLDVLEDFCTVRAADVVRVTVNRTVPPDVPFRNPAGHRWGNSAAAVRDAAAVAGYVSVAETANIVLLVHGRHAARFVPCPPVPAASPGGERWWWGFDGSPFTASVEQVRRDPRVRPVDVLVPPFPGAPPPAAPAAGRLDELRHEVLLLTAEVSRNHGLLLETRRTVRRLEETRLSFADHARASRLLAALGPRRVQGHRKVRVGPVGDGGYVLLDDWAGLRGVVSGGAGDNVDFERAALAHGLPVDVYDHTVHVLPGEADPLLHHYREPLGPAGTSLARTLERAPGGDLLLKVDIDGGEWDLLAPVKDELQRFGQIVVELHGLHELGDTLWFEAAWRALSVLRRTHAPVHVHANNHGAYAVLAGVPVPDIVEVTFARLDRYRFLPEPGADPAAVDTPNDPGRPEYVLFPFGTAAVLAVPATS